MPNYYYVKSNGTAAAGTNAGRYASQQTGSFATLGTANYYASIEDAHNALTAPVHGDFICISDASALSTATQLNYNNAPTGAGAGVSIVCVSDSACQTAAVASTALEHITGGGSDVRLNETTDGKVNIYGCYFKSDDDIMFVFSTTVSYLYKCTLEVTGSTDAIYFGGSSQYSPYIYMTDCTLHFGNSGALLSVRGGAQLRMIGGRVTGSKTDLIDTTLGSGGGALAHLIGVDLSVITDSIINEAAATSGALDIQIIRCRLASGVEYVDSVGGSLSFGQRILVANSAHDSSAEWQFYTREEQCDAEAVSSTYRNQSVAWPVTGSKTSIAIDVVTSGNTSPLRPFIIDLPSRYAALSASATDKITVYLSGQAGLTSKHVSVGLVYPDGTNTHIPNQIFSSSSPLDPFATGTALTSDTGSSWTSGGAANYRIEIDVTAVDPGADCVPIIRLYVQGLSSTLYVDSQVDLS